MTDRLHCAKCGTASAGSALRSLCPSCLLQLALEPGDGAERADEEAPPDEAYRVQTVLASGHDRVSYLAEHTGTRRLVTLDVVRLPPAGEDRELGRCAERLRALVRWTHPCAARVLEGRHTPSGDFCVVAEFVAGPRLDRYCESRRVDAATRASLFDVVCETVTDGHRHGICHGRLRPELVVATGSGRGVVPIVLGYSITPGHTPTVADDVSGLVALARSMGWPGPPGTPVSSVDGLRDAARREWPRNP